MIFANRSPAVSTPNESGITSNSKSPLTVPARIPPCKEAPIATHSSGLIPLYGSFPVMSATNFCTAGILVEPPTSRTLDRSDTQIPASRSTCSTGARVASTRSAVSSLKVARVSGISRFTALFLSCAINGKTTVVMLIPDSSIFAFSAASRTRCMAQTSLLRSIFVLFRKVSTMYCTIRSSKSSPPK